MFAIAILVPGSPPGIALAESPPDATVVSGKAIDVAKLPAASDELTPTEARNAEVTVPRLRDRGGTTANTPRALDTAPTGTGRFDADAVAAGFSAFSSLTAPFGGVWPMDATGSVVGNSLVVASRARINVYPTLRFGGGLAWSLSSFFAVPNDEFYWGAAVASSRYRGRFVAALPSFDGPSKSCAKGWLNVAVSSSSDPTKSWTRFRIPITDAFTDLVNIGVSDDKVVFSVNEWDLDAAESDCLGGTWEGARLRVVDWADLIDGGTLTVRDVSPAPRTAYYGWLAAVNVPGMAATTGGNHVKLVGDRFVDGVWGHLAYGLISGSAKSGTAKLATNLDLTTAAAMRPLVGPPGTIAAFPSGNGFQDERPLTVVVQGSQLWLSTNDTCRLDPDPTYRACARFIRLNYTTSPPTVLDDVSYVEVERDTFHPIVGVSRDGTSFYAMSASSAVEHEPIDQYMFFRSPGQAISGGSSETRVMEGRSTLEDIFNWGYVGSIVADPTDGAQAWATYPFLDETSSTGMTTRLKGGLTANPGGTFVLNNGSGWATGFWNGMTLYPDVASPTAWVRYSASPETEDLGNGPRLVHGLTRYSSPDAGGDFGSPELGGTGTGTSLTVYVQWQTGDGLWSTPTSQEAQLDSDSPVVSAPAVRFNSGTVGTSVPIRLSWTASDVGSGLARIGLSRARYQPSSRYDMWTYPATTTGTSQTAQLNGSYDWNTSAADVAGNGTAAMYSPRLTFKAYQGSSGALAYKQTWTSTSSTNYLGGSTRYATAAGATVTFTFTGRGVGFVTTKAASRGKAEVWVDGVKATTLDLYSSTTKYRQLVWQQSWATSGTHTVQVRALGTSGRPRIDADGFVKF